MRHVVLGAGGIGGFIAAVLARAGEDVQLLLRPSALATYPGAVEVDSAVLGAWEVPVAAVSALESRPDVLWVTTKATGLGDAIDALPASKVGDALVIPLLNGIDHVAALRGHYPRVAAGSIRVESERVAPGRIAQRSPFARIELAPPATGFGSTAEAREAVEAVAAVLRRAGLETTVSADEATLLWSKLAFLAPVALATTAYDAPLGDVRDRPEFLACQAEALAVADASGATVSAEGVRAAVAGAPAAMRSSMQKDVAAGQPPELDAIAGPILRGGERFGITVPHTTALVALVTARAGANGDASEA